MENRLMAATVAKAATAALEKERTASAGQVREGVAMQARGALLAGQGLIRGGATFTGDDAEGFRTWATMVSRKSWKTCESYIAIAKAHASLSTKADRTKAESLTFEQLQVLASTPADDRKTLLGEITTTTTPEEAREIRDNLKAAKLTPAEKKEREKAKKERAKQQAADKTQAAKEQLTTLLKGKQLAKLSPEQLLIIGALVGAAHGPDHGPDGVKAYFIAKAKVEQQLAERDAATAAAATAAAA